MVIGPVVTHTVRPHENHIGDFSRDGVSDEPIVVRAAFFDQDPGGARDGNHLSGLGARCDHRR